MFNFAFLNADEAYEQYVQSTYFSQMNEYELSLRLGKTVHSRDDGVRMMLSMYKNSVQEFTESEKDMLRFYMIVLVKFLSLKAPFCIPDKETTCFLKLNSDGSSSNGIALDWNYPYTINHCVVIPIPYLNQMISDSLEFFIQFKQKYGDGYSNPDANTLTQWTTNRPPYSLMFKYMCFFTHEFIHILQRNYALYPTHKVVFDKVYTDMWYFVKISKNDIDRNITDSPTFGIITDPDGYNYEWATLLFNQTKHYSIPFLPVLMLNETSKSPEAMLIEMVKKYIVSPYTLTKNHGDASKFRAYVERFYGLTKQLNHPNEIMAILLSEYVINGTLYSNTTNTTDYLSFYRYADKYIISTNFTPFANR